MTDKKTTDETTRSPVDGTESVRLATAGANWKATLSQIISDLSPKVRVTIGSSGDQGLVVANVSIGIQSLAGTGSFNMVGAPIELLFGGVSGFSIGPGATITSDWANLLVSTGSGTVFSDTVSGNDDGWDLYNVRCLVPITDGPVIVVAMDITSGGFGDNSSSSLYTGYTYNVPSYNVAAPAGFASVVPWSPGIGIVSVEATAGTGKGVTVVVPTPSAAASIGDSIGSGTDDCILFIGNSGKLEQSAYFTISRIGQSNPYFHLGDTTGNLLDFTTLRGFGLVLADANAGRKVWSYVGDGVSYNGRIDSISRTRWSLGFENSSFVQTDVLVWDANAHICVGASAAPGVSAGASINSGSTDCAGEVTLDGAGACTITFATAFSAVPFVTLSAQSGAKPTYTISASAITITGGGAGALVNYMTIGKTGG